MQLFSFRQGIANLENTIVGQTHDVSRPSLVDGRLALGHKLCRTAETQRLALTHMQVGLITLKLAATHLTEGDTRAMVGVDVGRNLEDKARELPFVRLYHTLLSLGGPGTGGYLHKAVKKFLYTEVVEGRTEEHGSHLGTSVGIHLEFRIDTVYQFKVFAQLGSILLPYSAVQFVTVDIYFHFFRNALFVWCKEIELMFVDIVDALELGTLVDRPRQGANLDFQFLLQFVEQVERVATFAVHLIDKDDDGSVAHAAHRHQFARLCLHALGTVDHDDGRVDGRQRAIGVFGKVLVTWRVEDIHLILHVRSIGRIVKLHDRGRHRDTTLFLDVHPVGGGSFLNLIILDGTGNLYLTTEKQELLSQCGLTSIRVRDNRECPSSFYLLIHNFSIQSFSDSSQ